MCPCGEFLEIYKIDKTFRLKTPEAIDPKDTNPNAPWVISPVADVGSSNPIVARVLLQGFKILEAAVFNCDVDKEPITRQLHSVKEALLACEKLAKRVGGHIDSIINIIKKHGLSKDNSGRALNPFPQVPDLEADCGTFLIQANRVIKLICALPRLFVKLDGSDTNFDHLWKRLERAVGKDSPLTEFVRNNAIMVRDLIELRNFHEHPKDIQTVIENFHVDPSGKIQVPSWRLVGKEVQEPIPIKEDMYVTINFLIQIAEEMLIHLVMECLSKQFHYNLVEVPDDKLDPKMPIKYRLSITLG